ncbi:MAG: hypothetical protein EOP83_09840 [Verrucomicrobiaceae bacterium]|nr:MAG: hypothetical protein EOP83_09840 [Verrucomicrobiaceae bacterium]
MMYELTKVQLSLIRRVMPSIIATEICSVQPMTGPQPMMTTLRARYGNGLARYDGCAGLDCGLGEEMTPSYGSLYGAVVDFPINHRLRTDPGQAVIWALQNVRCAFNYATVVIGCTLPVKEEDSRIESIRPALRVWRWTFADEDEAFAFKIRWM